MNACCVCRLGMPASEGVVLTVVTYLNNGKIDDAVARLAKEFRFKDNGMGAELKDRERLREFFQKPWKFYPASFLQTKMTRGGHPPSLRGSIVLTIFPDATHSTNCIVSKLITG